MFICRNIFFKLLNWYLTYMTKKNNKYKLLFIKNNGLDMNLLNWCGAFLLLKSMEKNESTSKMAKYFCASPHNLKACFLTKIELLSQMSRFVDFHGRIYKPKLTKGNRPQILKYDYVKHMPNNLLDQYRRNETAKGWFGQEISPNID